MENKMTINGKEITVDKPPVIKQLKLLELVKSNPEFAKEALSLNLNSEADFLASIATLVMKFVEPVAEYLVELLNGQVTKEDLLQHTSLDEIMVLVHKVLEVNRIDVIREYLKKSIALVQGEKKENPVQE